MLAADTTGGVASQGGGEMTKRRQLSTSADILSQVEASISSAVEEMAEEFSADRGRLCNEWTDFEVAPSLRMDRTTLVPPDFYRRLARAALRAVAPCPACRGTGHTDPLPDFEGDDPKTMRVCTMSFCQLCGGSGVDPNYSG